MTFSEAFAARNGSRFRRPAVYVIELCLIGLAYFALAKGGLALASINPSATPIWPPTGFALAAILLRGYRVWPAIFVAALLANAITAGSLATSFAISAGNTLEGGDRGISGQPLGRRPRRLRHAGRRRQVRGAQFSAHHGQRQHRRRQLGGRRVCRLVEIRIDLADLVARRSRRRAGGHAGHCLMGEGRAVGLESAGTARFGHRLRGRLRRRRACFQSADRADRAPHAARISGDSAVAVVGAAPRPARHRDHCAADFVLRGLGHARGRRPVRSRQSQRFLPDAAHVHDRYGGADLGAWRRCSGAQAHRRGVAPHPGRAEPAGRDAHVGADGGKPRAAGGGRPPQARPGRIRPAARAPDGSAAPRQPWKLGARYRQGQRGLVGPVLRDLWRAAGYA